MLPERIEQLLEALPVRPFDVDEEFQRLIYSEEFTEIFQYYKANFFPEALLSKPEHNQRISLYLKITNQNEYETQMDSILYRRPVPTIEEFLYGDYYHGPLTGTMYPYWRDKLCDMFKIGTPVRKAIFSGAIGTGKSTIARKASVYVLYRLLCLRHARATFNIEADSTIANFILSITLKQVYDTNLLPFIRILENMHCFQRVGNLTFFERFNFEDPNHPFPFYVEKSTNTIFFPDNIILTAGSQVSHTVGYNIVNSFVDEINEKGVTYAMEFLNSIDSRFASRFQGSDYVFQSIVSSARTTNSPVGEYIRKLPKNDPSISILTPMLWECKEDPEFLGDGTTFPVLVGNGSIPSRIVEDPGELLAIKNKEFEEPVGCTLIQVPTVYKSKFELKLDQSIQDIAGMTTNDNNSVFRDTSRLEDFKLIPELYFDANIREDIRLLDLLPQQDLFEKNIKEQWRLIRAPNASRYIHIDLAGGGSDGQCDACICMLHKEWQYNEITRENDTIYVVDFIIFINAKTKIDINAIQRLCEDLVIERGVPIYTISADQYQSTLMLQNLEASGRFTKVEKVSVDTKLEPYINAATAIELGRVKTGSAPKLKKELESLVIVKNKVVKTTELKDGPDALVGAIYDAQIDYRQGPTYQYIPNNQDKIEIKYEDLINIEKEELQAL